MIAKTAEPQKVKMLFITPSYLNSVYKHSKMKTVMATFPLVGTAVLAGTVHAQGHDVAVADLNTVEDVDDHLSSKLETFNPNYVGISFTTPLFNEVRRIAERVKKFNNEIKIIVGGPHASAMPRQTLEHSLIDLVVIGEGDHTIVEIVSGKEWKSIPGVMFRNGQEIVTTPGRSLIENMNDMPYPAWHLYDISKYKGTPLFNRRNPLGFFETSRGCFSRCSYCSSRNIFGMKFRCKTPERVVDEIEYMLNIGFREIHPIDDGFTTNIERAKSICNEIIRRGIKMPWYPQGGLRVDRVNRELFDLMVKAGCYRIPFGIESGSQLILDTIKKGIKLEQVVNAVKWANEAGLETLGYFMLGLPGETEDTIKETISFSQKLNLHYAKFALTIPLPGSPLYANWEKDNLIKTHDWEKYNFATPEAVFTHPNLSWDELNEFYKIAHRSFYWRPSYFFKRLLRNFKEFNLMNDVREVLKVKW